MKASKNFLIYSFIGLFCLTTNWAYGETLEELANEVSEIQAELKALPPSDVKESIVIDNAVEIIDQTVNFVIVNINTGDTIQIYQMMKKKLNFMVKD